MGYGLSLNVINPRIHCAYSPGAADPDSNAFMIRLTGYDRFVNKILLKEKRNMKKNYESPKAEKMEFNYSETVVAASAGCRTTHVVGDQASIADCNTQSYPDTLYFSNQA